MQKYGLGTMDGFERNLETWPYKISIRMRDKQAGFESAEIDRHLRERCAWCGDNSFAGLLLAFVLALVRLGILVPGLRFRHFAAMGLIPPLIRQYFLVPGLAALPLLHARPLCLLHVLKRAWP